MNLGNYKPHDKLCLSHLYSTVFFSKTFSLWWFNPKERDKTEKNSEAKTKFFYYLAPTASQNKVSIDILLPKLLSSINTEGSISIIDEPLWTVTQDCVGPVDFFKLWGKKCCMRYNDPGQIYLKFIQETLDQPQFVG